MAGSTVAIMQPTYFPWSGYFDLMDQCDTFVLLDCVQFEKRSWQQRNRIKTPQGELWLTVPVLTKGKQEQKIFEVQIDRSRNFHEQHIKTVHHHYRKARYYQRYFDEFASILRKGHAFLADLNIELIEWLRGAFGITGRLIRSSSLNAQGDKVDRLLSICRAVGASIYVSPPGSQTYIEENNQFMRSEIELHYHAYQPQSYRQLHESFVPYLSALDLLLNEGHESLTIIRSGRRAA